MVCASCHASEALGTGSFSTIPPLTASVHSKHAAVLDPELGVTLDNASHRAACYRCHPGSATRCLRGAMGGAIARDGTMAMQCQSCHGGMSAVGSLNRVGWFMEPSCQGCHTGTAMSNNGQIRYTSVFEANGTPRVPLNATFATQPDTPAPGLSLYRFSAGHGAAGHRRRCHPSSHLPDRARLGGTEQRRGDLLPRSWLHRHGHVHFRGVGWMEKLRARQRCRHRGGRPVFHRRPRARAPGIRVRVAGRLHRRGHVEQQHRGRDL